MGKEPPTLFHDDELVTLSHFDKRENRYVSTIFPKIGGRLRLAHEDNQALSITTEIVQYDQSLAVISATVTTSKGKFNGFGMASAERDRFLAVAILELAESRAIARALRFAGYGVEYCGAEEVSHLEGLTNGQGRTPPSKSPPGGGAQPSPGEGNVNGDRHNQAAGTDSPHPAQPGEQPTPAGKGNNHSDSRVDKTNNHSDKPETRLTNRQLKYIITLGKNLGLDGKALDTESVKDFGVKVAHLKISEASSFIDRLSKMSK
ncbi:MAG: hypothetical protein HQK56_13145 [Deltaproteobacteria bacterium]|nr:hypothetical protein [Deltaproteobacteria bacterium]